jgi:NAD+ kinase
MIDTEIGTVLVIANCEKPKAQNLAEQIQSYLKAKHIPSYLFTFQGKAELPVFAHVQLAITLGGDGTVLFAARALATQGIPILPVNLGNFGFITEVSQNEWQEALDAYFQGASTFGHRILAKVEVFRNFSLLFESNYLNDAVISGAGISKILSLSASLSETEIGKYRADGIIISTPTGSTAYSAAAGGPILHPEMNALILNPICPFTLSHRPLVISGDENITITIDPIQRTQVILTLDGQLEYPLMPGDKIHISKASHGIKILNSQQRNFYEVLRSKLNWSGGPDA